MVNINISLSILLIAITSTSGCATSEEVSRLYLDYVHRVETLEKKLKYTESLVKNAQNNSEAAMRQSRAAEMQADQAITRLNKLSIKSGGITITPLPSDSSEENSSESPCRAFILIVKIF